MKYIYIIRATLAILSGVGFRLSTTAFSHETEYLPDIYKNYQVVLKTSTSGTSLLRPTATKRQDLLLPATVKTAPFGNPHCALMLHAQVIHSKQVKGTRNKYMVSLKVSSGESGWSTIFIFLASNYSNTWTMLFFVGAVLLQLGSNNCTYSSQHDRAIPHKACTSAEIMIESNTVSQASWNYQHYVLSDLSYHQLLLLEESNHLIFACAINST